MMNKTKIEWADSTWNPITGCLHGCPYCYAKDIARRFGKKSTEDGGLNYLGEPIRSGINFDGPIQPYPYGFDPTFHRYRLDECADKKKPRNIFVCSMGDMFGNWVPDSWIKKVFEACKAAPQHRYLFLTKNPARYDEISLTINIRKCRPNWYFGTTVTGKNQSFYSSSVTNSFLSIEPILSGIGEIDLIDIDWVIIGAETGNRKGKIVPKREWVENIVNAARAEEIPVFMKDSLAKVWGEPLIQEFPW